MKIDVRSICGTFAEVKFSDLQVVVESGTLDCREMRQLAETLSNAAAELIQMANKQDHQL